MDRCKVICHMAASIDGKITGRFMKEPLVETTGAYYMETLEAMCSNMATGRATNDTFLSKNQVDYTRYADADVDYEDFIVKDPDQRYFISFDRKGSCNWTSNYFEEYKRYLVIEVLTKAAKKEYVAHLKELGLPYIFAGDKEMDIELALKKLKAEFGIETLALCGGAVLNGAFFKEDLIDEISLVISPYVEGSRDAKSFVELWADYRNTAFPLKEAKPIDGGGVHLVFGKV